MAGEADGWGGRLEGGRRLCGGSVWLVVGVAWLCGWYSVWRIATEFRTETLQYLHAIQIPQNAAYVSVLIEPPGTLISNALISEWQRPVILPTRCAQRDCIEDQVCNVPGRLHISSTRCLYGVHVQNLHSFETGPDLFPEIQSNT